MHTFDLDLEHVTKVEGAANVHVKVKDGKVESVQYAIAEFKRFYTRGIEGKPLMAVPQLLSRICGTCSNAHILCAIEACEHALAEGNSIMMFPEGTRSEDGRLKAFKHGAFTLAQRMRVPILPIVIEGTAAALPKRGFLLQGRHAIRIRVLDAIPCARFANLSVETLTEEVRNIFAVELGECDADAPVVAHAGARPA